MRKDWLAVIDICAVGAAMMILFMSWFYLPHETFAWGVILAGLVIALAICLNVKYFLSVIIEARRTASGKPGPGPKKRWLVALNYAAAIVIIVIIAIFWFYLPHELVGWGIRFALLLLLLVCLVNVWNLIVDFIDSGKTAA